MPCVERSLALGTLLSRRQCEGFTLRLHFRDHLLSVLFLVGNLRPKAYLG